MAVTGFDIDGGRGGRRGAVEQARAYVAHELDSRRFAPGDRLPPASALALEIGVSRPAVLQALQLLQQEGRLLVRPGRAGTVVVEPEPDNLDARVARLWERREALCDLAVCREALEPGIARISAERGLPKDALREARRLLARMKATDDPSEWLACDYEFHRAISRGAGRKLVDALVGAFRATVTQVFEVIELTPELRRRCDTEHERILEAIAAGDGRAAFRHMDRHVSASARIIEELLGPDGAAGPDELLHTLSTMKVR